ncbi:pyrimidine 5'-nucleotidase [Pacificimonas flava]|uniref:Pyrimidine 5'-nucleotidase n=2 Tax=Pacificimonas TaxID=1960290 RepID=A0A219B2U4_9SPHN|nr:MULTISPECIES: pyrimidine 5'-nucleotidase [Pacificimonas]MBZ6377663.1 pyrimidine 5'-nucleotidase [Pacificimonas aurantium]OWV32655.1 pyrimidine 5'-nucleotidase [Pacificimonas flava]
MSDAKTARGAKDRPDFRGVETWLFDLDNTLYPASANLFSLIDKKMGAFIARELGVDAVEARRIQKDFFHRHGTTLRGLMDEHGVDPHHFLDFVHDIEMTALSEDPRVARGIEALPGRKLVFTNGDESYARRVLERLGLHDHFEHVHDIHAMNYRPKPDPAVYADLCDRLSIEPRRAAFVEDMARNLVPAKALGMRTIWIDNGSESAGYDADPGAIDLVIEDLGDWLSEWETK